MTSSASGCPRPWATPRPSSRGSRARRSRAGRVVDPPSQPRRRQLLVVHRPGLAELARDAARGRGRAKSLLLLPVARPRRRPSPSTCGAPASTCFVHHSAVSREERQLAEERFHHGSDACIVCTSTLELGIDVGDLDRVLQAEAPDTVSSFLQRMGRTGRRQGRSPTPRSSARRPRACCRPSPWSSWPRPAGSSRSKLDRRCWPVLIHQLLAMALASDGDHRRAPGSTWRACPTSRAFTGPSTTASLTWMVRDGSLAARRRAAGPGAEGGTPFGRKNFMELFAVFSSPQTYTVQTAAGRALGSLEPGLRRPARRRHQQLPARRPRMGRPAGTAR